MNFSNWYPTINNALALKYNQNFEFLHFGETGVVNDENIDRINSLGTQSEKFIKIVFYDMEPFSNTYDIKYLGFYNDGWGEGINRTDLDKRPHRIIATSDYGNKLLDTHIGNVYAITKRKFKIWYYFSHALIALDWFREYRFYQEDDIINQKSFDFAFTTSNRLVTGARNYRLSLVSEILSRNIGNRGITSCTKENLTFDNKFDISLPKDRIEKIKKFCNVDLRYDFKDAETIVPNQSMHINTTVANTCFMNVVTETCFYDRFNHLTEKVFKPIIMLQPFIICSTPNSLKFLKRYGFKTFDKWIDESYDSISNPEKRINAVVDQIEKLAKLSKQELTDIYTDMLPTLKHNRFVFFNTLYDTVTSEMWDNLDGILSTSGVEN